MNHSFTMSRAFPVRHPLACTHSPSPAPPRVRFVSKGCSMWPSIKFLNKTTNGHAFAALQVALFWSIDHVPNLTTSEDTRCRMYDTRDMTSTPAQKCNLVAATACFYRHRRLIGGRRRLREVREQGEGRSGLHAHRGRADAGEHRNAGKRELSVYAYAYQEHPHAGSSMVTMRPTSRLVMYFPISPLVSL